MCSHCHAPMDPPADNEQNSKSPSQAGLSSPTRTGSTSAVLYGPQTKRENTYIASRAKTACRTSLALRLGGSARTRRCGTWSSALPWHASLAAQRHGGPWSRQCDMSFGEDTNVRERSSCPTFRRQTLARGSCAFAGVSWGARDRRYMRRRPLQKT